MGRIRTIKPEFFTNEEFSALLAETQLLAAGLLCYADDEGYFNAHSSLIKAAIFPLRECSLSTQDMLMQLQKIGFLRFGTTPDGKRWGQVVKFTTHQRVNRPTPSRIRTLPISWEDSAKTHGGFTDPSVSTHENLTEGSLPEGKGKEGKGKELKPSPAEKRGSGDSAKSSAKLLQAAPTPAITPPIEWPERPPTPDPDLHQPPKVPESKPPTKTDLAKLRHTEFKAAILLYWRSQNPTADMPWDGAEGKNLDMWLRASRQTTLEQFQQYLVNRIRSEGVNHAERPSLWIRNVTSYAAGPLDRFGKPLNSKPPAANPLDKMKFANERPQ